MPTLYSSEQAPSSFDLRRSFGPYLALADDQYLFDLYRVSNLGYNASAGFGTIHAVESWTENKQSENWSLLSNAAIELKSRQSGRSDNIKLLVEEFKPAVFHHYYIENAVLEQYDEEAKRIDSLCLEKLKQLARRFEIFSVIEPGNKWNQLEFRLQFTDPSVLAEFYRRRFQFGLNFWTFTKPPQYVAIFNLNLSYRIQDIELLFQQIERLLRAVTGQQDSYPSVEISLPGNADNNYQFAELMIESRLAAKLGTPADQTILNYVQSNLPVTSDDREMEVSILDVGNYSRFRSAILNMQSAIYEPARQSPPQEFDAIFDSDNPVAIVVHQAEQIMAMGFAGPISIFHDVRGMENDPFRNATDVLYMVDITVVPEFRGGTGRVIKNAISLIGLQKGFTAIHGRNRDRLARGMWAINLSLGCFELQHLVDDYPDQNQFRDCFYYRCPLSWPNPPQITMEQVRNQLPILVNGGEPEFSP